MWGWMVYPNTIDNECDELWRCWRHVCGMSGGGNAHEGVVEWLLLRGGIASSGNVRCILYVDFDR
jgi:hypothetical protein